MLNNLKSKEKEIPNLEKKLKMKSGDQFLYV